MKKILILISFIWELPQLIIGILYLIVMRVKFKSRYRLSFIFAFNKYSEFGISFGKVIALPSEDSQMELLAHEYGHSIQSMMLGPFYLFVVGLTSSMRYLYYALKSKNEMDEAKKMKIWEEYYRGFPESWANNLAQKYYKAELSK